MTLTNTAIFEQVLTSHQLKKTLPRLKVLSVLHSKKTATSQPYLESVMDDIDRVTLYRILNIFEEKGIIHKIFDLDGTANYAVCLPGCLADHHHDEHIHFNCKVCKKLYCLDNFIMPALNFPAGFKPGGYAFYATGLCPECS